MLQEADCKKMVDTAVEKFGALHVAFNNAGIFRTSSLADITEEAIDASLNVNVKSLAFCLKYQVLKAGFPTVLICPLTTSRTMSWNLLPANTVVSLSHASVRRPRYVWCRRSGWLGRYGRG